MAEPSKLSMSESSEPPIPIDEHIRLRNQHIAESCELHFSENPLKITRSMNQYLFDDMENQYLDFVTRTTNVGHCNDAVVNAASQQMKQLNISGHVNIRNKLNMKIFSTLPPSFDAVLYTNSGGEANDLAVQMVRKYTNRHDLVVVDGAFHGFGNLLVDISPRAFKATPEGKKSWVHVIPAPDTYRGPYGKDEPEAGEKYFQDAKNVIQKVIEDNHQIAGFICEPVMVSNGLIIPPPHWLSKIYSYIHELGGIVIADEIQCGMGRMGDTFWAFQGQNAVPDIITVGKPMGNGHPIAAVITSRKIAETVKDTDKIYTCDPVGATISLAVFSEMEKKKLMENAVKLGHFLAEQFEKFQINFPIIGDVRHKGLIVAIDIVRERTMKKPAPELAEEICNYLRKQNILVGCEGEHKNVLLFLPPMCLTHENCIQVIEKLDYVLKCVELNFLNEIFDLIQPNSPGDVAGPSTSSGTEYLYPDLPELEDPALDDLEEFEPNPYDALD